MFGINQEMNMIVVPNSCFSVIFVDPRFHDIKADHSVVINLPSSHKKLVIVGEWIEMNIMVNTFDITDTWREDGLKNESKIDVRIKVFVSIDFEKVVEEQWNGFIGVAKCPS